MPPGPLRVTAIRCPSTNQRTLRTFAVELAVTTSDALFATHSRISGNNHVTAGPSTTSRRRAATDVFGRTFSLTDAVFLAS